MNITAKQKKAAWSIVAVLIIIHYAGPIVTTVRQRLSGISPAPAVSSKPSPAHPFPPALTGQASLFPGAADPSQFIGVWAGSELMPDRNVCRLRLEVRKDDKRPDEFSGYVTRSCGTTAPTLSMQSISEVIREGAPINGILRGQLVNGTIQLHLEKAIGANRCELTDYSITRFGEQLAAEWKPGTCPAGTMMLAKERI
jgi:hypothetical protein